MYERQEEKRTVTLTFLEEDDTTTVTTSILDLKDQHSRSVIYIPQESVKKRDPMAGYLLVKILFSTPDESSVQQQSYAINSSQEG